MPHVCSKTDEKIRYCWILAKTKTLNGSHCDIYDIWNIPGQFCSANVSFWSNEGRCTTWMMSCLGHGELLPSAGTHLGTPKSRSLYIIEGIEKSSTIKKRYEPVRSFCLLQGKQRQSMMKHPSLVQPKLILLIPCVQAHWHWVQACFQVSFPWDSALSFWRSGGLSTAWILLGVTLILMLCDAYP